MMSTLLTSNVSSMRSLKADGSVMITASHNTKEWNGCKLCKANAVPISGATGIKDIEKIFEGISLNEPPAGVGEVTKVDVSAQYAEHVKTFAHLKRPLHLALDFANGMGIAEAVAFKDSMITYDALYGEYDGNFPNHDANPLKTETLADLQAFIRANPGKYAFGVAYDGDADRAGFVLISPDWKYLRSGLMSSLSGLSLAETMFASANVAIEDDSAVEFALK